MVVGGLNCPISPGGDMANRNAKPTAAEEPGLIDPRHMSPAPADPSPGVSAPLELEPLPGPTEASDNVPPPADSDGEALVDPRFLTPGPGKPASPDQGNRS